jgi:heptosyltransferase-2
LSKKILVIQTAFIGDAILVTSLLESIHAEHPEYILDLLIRKGNESLFKNHPFIRNCIVLDRKKSKISELLRLVKTIRSNRYECVINVQRFFTSGFLTVFSGSKLKIGFKKNPLSFGFDIACKHDLNSNQHEISRNFVLLKPLGITHLMMPKLYPIQPQNELPLKYVCIAPASVWFTKQWPIEKWVELIQHLNSDTDVLILGTKEDFKIGEAIQSASKRTNIYNFCGEFSLLESAWVMQHAQMNYVNDSAPLHLCSATDAPVTAIFCSTIPEFGFGPLSTKSIIWQTNLKLDCRPCGLHGHKKCPEGHFKCAYSIIPNLV